MKSSRLEKKNIIKDVKNLFRLQKKKKRIDGTAMKHARNIFRLKKEINDTTVKDRIIRDIRNLFEHEEGDYYKPVRVGNFWSNNYIEYESIDDRNKALSFE